MAGSDSSIHGGHHDGHHEEDERRVSRAEMRCMADSLVEAMGRMFDARLLAAGGRRPRRD
jgi:hypothetical protein